MTKKSPYSIDQNLWGRAVETGFLEDIWNGPVEDVYDYRRPVGAAGARRVVITFERGAPVAIDGGVSVLDAVLGSTDGPAHRASGGWTSSRTSWSASRAARSTRPPARSR